MEAMSLPGPSRSDALPALAGQRRALQVSALAYDPAHDELIAGVVAADGQASLQGIDPVSLETHWTLRAPDEITRLGISSDGSTLYGALTYSGMVWQVDLSRRAEVRQIIVANATAGEGPADLTIRPGSPGTFAVSIVRWDLPTRNFLRLTVYDDGAPRLKSTSSDGPYGLPDDASEIVFVDADHVVGYDIHSTGCSLSRLALASDGLMYEKSVMHIGECFNDQLNFVDGHLITLQGAEYDPATLAPVRYWQGTGSDFGGGFLDTARDAWVRINGDQLAAVNSDTRQRALVEEYENARHTLRRTFVTDEPTQMGVAFVANIANMGKGRIAFTVMDLATGLFTLYAYDLTTVAPLGSAFFAAQGSSTTSASALAVDVAPVDMAYDPGLQRLVLALPAGVGPDGNSLALMNPSTGAIERLIKLNEQPSLVRVSASGSIAYVATVGAFSIAQVDLAAGKVVKQVSARADGFAIKTDDPHVVAVFKNDTVSHRTITTMRDLSPFGTAVDLSTPPFTFNLIDWIGTNGSQVVGLASSTSDLTLARFAWSQDGLILASSGYVNSLGTGAGSIGTGFGSLWNNMNVVDLSTLQSRGSFDPSWLTRISRWSAVLTGPSTAMMTGPSNGLSFAAAWVEAPPDANPALGWQPRLTLAITDNGLPADLANVDPHQAVDCGANGVAIRAQWLGSGGRQFQPGRVYLLKQR
jgi:hypothetical protein